MDLLQGTLDLLILRALELAPMHGVGIAARIEQVTRGAFAVKPGSMFPALRRLQQKGWIGGEWAVSENNRRARYYRLTRTGRRQLV
jgi:PadR family transcriptional regulator PadR